MGRGDGRVDGTGEWASGWEDHARSGRLPRRRDTLYGEPSREQHLMGLDTTTPAPLA